MIIGRTFHVSNYIAVTFHCRCKCYCFSTCYNASHMKNSKKVLVTMKTAVNIHSVIVHGKADDDSLDGTRVNQFIAFVLFGFIILS